jgi:general L-amino acid transport system permease protein
MTDRDPRRTELGLGLGEDVDLLRFQEAAGAIEAPPEAVPQTPLEWVKRNLFSGWLNSTVTVLLAAIVGFALFKILRFIFVTGEWAVIKEFMRGYMVGSFPEEELWRVWTCAYLVAALGGLSYGSGRRRPRLGLRRVMIAAFVATIGIGLVFFVTTTATVRFLMLGLPLTIGVSSIAGWSVGPVLKRPLLIAWILAFPAILVIILGFGGVSPRLWGGFFFNLLAATVGIAASFPIGILLALGRRSDLPAVRFFSIGFIELFRGVPLVAWLIFSKYVVTLLLPPQLDTPDIIKALIAMTAFSSAYVGEIVRGGLQGVDYGQFDAARALGLSPPRLMTLIILPQALRSTIPAMISHFISLFKDTSLFVAIEVTELLEAARRSAISLEFLGTTGETLAFAGLMFWIIAFTMSRWSQRLEVRLGLGER